MKILKSIFLFSVLITFSSCGGDDDEMTSECQISDWLGTYEGSSAGCLTVGDPEDVTITISEDSGFISVNVLADGGELEVLYSVDGCIATSVGLPGSGTLDGNNITFRLEPDCMLTGTK